MSKSVAQSGSLEGRNLGQVEVTRRGPRGQSRWRQRVLPFFDDLSGDDLLIVGTGHEPGILEPGHHLIERWSRSANAVLRELAPDVASATGVAAEHADDEKLEMGDAWNSDL